MPDAEDYEADGLLWKYHNDPLFHALVHHFGCSSFVDDDGVRHEGPTVADARRMQAFLDALPNGFAKIDGDAVWLRKVVDTSGYEDRAYFVIVTPTAHSQHCSEESE